MKMKVELTSVESALLLKHVQSEIRKVAKYLETAKVFSADKTSGSRLGWELKIPNFESELQTLIELENKLSS
jgi:hypothetical protein